MNPSILKMNEVRFKKMAEKRQLLILSGVKFCKKCQTDKPFSEYANEGNGRCSTYCKQCNSEYSKARTKHASENLTDWYIKDFGRRHYGLKMKATYPAELMEALKAEILARRAAVSLLTIDGKKFTSMNEFAKYASKKYKIGPTAICARLTHGKSLSEALIPHEVSKRCAKGINIKVVNQQTGEIKYYLTLRQAELDLHIGQPMIKYCLKTGNESYRCNNAVTKHTFKIYKDEQGEGIKYHTERIINSIPK